MTLRRRFWLLLLAAVLSAPLYMLYYGLQEQAEVNIRWSFSKTDIVKARHILNQNPLADSPLQMLELNEKELNLAANYLLNRYAKSATLIGLHADSLSVLISLDVPQNPFGNYLNIRLILTFDQGRRNPVLSEVKIGKLHIHPRLAAWLIDAMLRYTALQHYYILASNQISDIELYARRIVIIYRSGAETVRQARSLLNLDPGGEALAAYRERLNTALDQHDAGWRLSLTELLQPLFALAAQRSTPDTAIEENRAVIYTVAAYVNNQKLPVLLEEPQSEAELQRYPVFAYKRIDMAQHFMASAALSAAGNSYFGNKLGEEKELHDAAKGSGFSFIDLAADRAGLKFGEIAVSNPENARSLQLAMAKVDNYNAFIPDVSDLPEHMDEETFKNRFESLDSAATQSVMAEIDARIDKCPIFAAFKE